MSLESVLLLFDFNHPVWDFSTVEMAGEDPSFLMELVQCGLVEERDGCFVLTESGVREFETLRDQCFLDSPPGLPPSDPPLWLRRNRLEMAFKGAFAGRWGNKRTHPGVKLSFLAPPMEAVFEGPRFTGWRVSGKTAHGVLELDLLLLFDYDFSCYMGSPRHPEDHEGVLNADRVLMVMADELDLRMSIARLGDAHRWLWDRRRVFGSSFDLDCQGQDSVTWWAWVAQEEGHALELHRRLEPFGEALCGPSKPLDLWVLSLEALAGAPRDETFYDLFHQVGHRVFASGAVG
ncbi:MAG: hypothetical protein N2315_04995 [Thermanaerothrix sp.]|nr:hypothetical protein [Thermanaerothrix sp.]